jgi:ribose transport system permease protein
MTARAVNTIVPEQAEPARGKPKGSRLVARLGLVRLSGVYGLIALIALFSALYPGTFLTSITLKTTLGDQAITGILALGALVPLTAGMIDLSFAAVAGFGLIFISWLSNVILVPDIVLVVITLGACACFGLVSSVLVAYLGMGSLIVTLGMSSVALGLAEKVSNNNTLTPRLGDDLIRLGSGTLFGLPMTFVVLLILAVIVLVWLEYTPGGRYTLAAGDNPVAAKLAGVRVARVQAGSLVVSSVIAGFAGVLLAASIGEASTVTTTGYLLPVVAGLMLGATQVKGRPNVLGTIIAVYLIGVGLKGLQLGGAEQWVNDVFNGGVLLAVLALTAIKIKRSR